MALNYKFTTNQNFLVISTSKQLSISTASTTFALDSSNRAMEVTNLGPANLFLSGSGALMGSGAFLGIYANKTLSNLGDDFILTLRADSATTVVNINEYR